MPAPVPSQSSSRKVNQPATQKSRAIVVAKKKRPVRRRGRAKGDLDSDDEVEREVVTDSESEDDNLSSVDSPTDNSDADGPVIEDNRAHLPTPRNSKSPETAVQVDDSLLKNGVESFFSPSGNWSDMVAEENANGVESLPLERQKSHSPSRNFGHATRQAYQHRLETDPSYVPTIGNFWGHDDRLIDANLRSLSGWWRGRGRRRGRGSAMRVREGRQGAPLNAGSECEDLAISLDGKLPPIDRPWTHDGFEDMKRKEERRRAVTKQQKTSHHAGSSTEKRTQNPPLRGEAPFPATIHTVPPAPATRARFQMKRELMWTKQHEAFLYSDSSLKPIPGQGSGVRINLPGHQATVVRSSLSSTRVTASPFDHPEDSEGGDRVFVVCLPKKPKEAGGKEVEEDKSNPSSRSDIFAEPINSHAGTSKLLVSQFSSIGQPQPTVISQLGQLTLQPQTSDPERQAKTEEAVLRMPSVEVDNEVSEDSSTSERLALPTLRTTFTPPPQLPMSQPSPIFNLPYGYSPAPALPLGIAMNQHGVLYEVATGRPVYLQPAPLYNPRPLMHTHMAPPAIPFVPGHMPHPSSSASTDFLPHPPHTPPVNGFIDSLTGTPIFSFPRQTSRIEIRSPTEEPRKPAKSVSRTSSGLRTTAPSFQPSRSSENLKNGYYHTTNSVSDTGTAVYGNINGQASDEDVGMMAYPNYQQLFYHTEPYGYSQYMDMSQAGQYDMYNMDQQAAQGAVYY